MKQEPSQELKNIKSHQLFFVMISIIFPMKTHRYGIAGYPTVPHWVQLPSGARIMEVPVAIWSSGKIRIPVAGGGYFRLIPGIILEADHNDPRLYDVEALEKQIDTFLDLLASRQGIK
jgi:hypothetical protein